MFNGLDLSLGTLPLLSNAVSRSISAENMTGAKGEGGKATEGTGLSAARNLGKGWKVSPCIEIAPGDTVTIADIEGPGQIQMIWMTGYVGRDLILRFYWDNQEMPSVECPQADFFACGWFDNAQSVTNGQFKQLCSQMICVNPNRGMSCYWPMPFKKHCKLTVENRGESPRFLFYQISYTLTEVPEDIGYFHAQYRQARPLAAMTDYTIVDGITGKGQYVGTALSVGLNGNGRWWGEGEVKFFFDGDKKYPTICGTGTEDYFLGAYDWDVEGKYQTYNSPYAGMFYVNEPDGTYNSQQRFSMYRWHVIDPVRFENDLKVTIQDLGWFRDGRYMPRQDDFSSVAYWYQTLPTPPTFPKLPDVDELEV